MSSDNTEMLVRRKLAADYHAQRHGIPLICLIERVLPSSCRPQVQNASQGVSPRRGWSTSILLGTRVAVEQPEYFRPWFYEHLKGSPGPTLSFPTVFPVLINFFPVPTHSGQFGGFGNL